MHSVWGASEAPRAHAITLRQRRTRLRLRVRLPHGGQRLRPVQCGDGERDGNQRVHDGDDAVGKVGGAAGAEQVPAHHVSRAPGCDARRELHQRLLQLLLRHPEACTGRQSRLRSRPSRLCATRAAVRL